MICKKCGKKLIDSDEILAATLYEECKGCDPKDCRPYEDDPADYYEADPKRLTLN